MRARASQELGPKDGAVVEKDGEEEKIWECEREWAEGEADVGDGVVLLLLLTEGERVSG